MPPYAGNGEPGVDTVTATTRGTLRNALTAPIIYSVAVPLLLLDAWVTLYQYLCFPLYGMVRVRRADYLVIDRHRLPYLTRLEKLHCLYCSYATGVLVYVQEVTARTEQYWCPIKHSTAVHRHDAHYQLFFDYGDGAGYRRGQSRLRTALRPLDRAPSRQRERAGGT